MSIWYCWATVCICVLDFRCGSYLTLCSAFNSLSCLSTRSCTKETMNSGSDVCVRAYSVIHIAFHYSLHDCGLSVTRAAVPRCIACGTSVHLAHVEGCFSIKRQRCAGTKSERKPVLAESSYLLDASSIESFMQQTDTEERKQSQRRRESKRQRRAGATRDFRLLARGANLCFLVCFGVCECE